MRSILVLALLAVATSAHAQPRAWEVDRHLALDATTVSVEVSPSSDGAPTRIRVRGTIDSALDGARMDAVSLRHGDEIDRALGTPLVLSPGAEVVQSEAASHAYVIEAPPGTPIRATLAIPRLAAAHLVTATELRESLRGALEVDVMRRAPLASTIASIAPEESSPWLGSLALAMTLALAGVAFFARREPEEAALVRRARRARDAIVARARALGPAHHGVASSARDLETSVRSVRALVAQVDAALRSSRWTRSEAARRERDELTRRRALARHDLERMTGELESALVRLGSIEAARLAAPDVEADLRRLRDEVDLGEQVERDVARL